MRARRHGWGEANGNGSSDDDSPQQRRGSSHHTNEGSISTHSGVFADDEDDDHHAQATRMTDQKILDNARFGLATVRLKGGGNSNASRRTSMNVGGARRLISRRSSDLAIAWAQRIEKLAWKASLFEKVNFAQLAITLYFIDSLYILFTVPLRLGFFFDPWNQPASRLTWTTTLTVFTTFDLVGVSVHAWFSRKELQPLLQRIVRYCVGCCLRRVSPIDKPRLFSVLRASFIGDADMMSFRSQISEMSGRSDRVSAADALPVRSRSKSRHRYAFVSLLAIVFNCFPLELIFIVAVKNYNVLHLIGLTRFIQAARNAPRQFTEVVLTRYRHFPFVQALSFSTIASIVYLIVAGMYLIHTAASGYMLIAHWQCGLCFTQCQSSPQLPGTWVQRDRLEHGTLWRKYVRSLYWGSKTVTTLGQGDVVPATEFETAYRVIVQFISGLWATAILTAYSFYFSRKDAKMKTNLTTRLEQATMFLASRHLPTAITKRVQTYFEYMQRTRFGVEEELTLQALPAHYHTQCLNYVKFRSFQRLPMFKNRDGAFLRTILGSLEKDYFAPHQVVLAIGDVEDMFVVATGEINVLDANRSPISRLTPGNAHAERALFLPWSKSEVTLIADTHCEVWVLHHSDFRAALKNHFSKLKYAGIMTSNFSKLGHAVAGKKAKDPALAVRKFELHSQATTNKLLRKMSTADLKGDPRGKKQASWRLPQSKFQRTWKHAKCVFLLFLLYEVPYQIAFQRGFGLLDPLDLPTTGAIPREFQLFSFAVSLLVEIFFYVDWYLRAQVFFRYVMSGSGSGDAADSNASYGILKEKSLIFRHYLENENVWVDVLQHLPIPLVWDVLPKQSLSSRVVYVARFVRTLRLLRLQHFHSVLRSIMIDHAMAPSKRLLVYVVIFCTASAHIAACVFFLVGDFDEFRGGLPVEGVRPGSMTAFECLQDATLFLNCTWYQYDRSTYNIDAPFLRALQWSVVLQSTVGFGEIMSFSSRECVVGCMWIFIGANICYCTGCVLSSILAQLSIQSTIQQEHMEEINLALVNAPNVSERTKTLVRSYYATKWQMNGSAQQDEEILAHLPRSIRHHVQDAVHVGDLEGCYLFAHESGSSTAPSLFIRELARLVRSEVFLKDVMIIRQGHAATEFFVLQSGEAELLLPPLQSLPESRTGSLDTVSGGGDTIVSHDHAAAPAKLPWSEWDLSALLPKDARRGSVTKRSTVESSLRSRTSARESMVLSRSSAIFSRAMKISLMDLRLPMLRRRPSFSTFGGGMIPISILERHDCFGEESLAPQGAARTYQFGVRVVASAQVAVIRRRDLYEAAARFPDEFKKIYSLLDAKAERDAVLLRALQNNFMHKDKIARRLGIPQSLYVDRTKLITQANPSRRDRLLRVIDPEETFARWWYRLVAVILVYNFYAVIFRIAFLPRPKPTTMLILTIVDYLCDIVLYVDIVLKYNTLGYVHHGQKIMSKDKIRERYVATWLKQDCWSMLPTFYYGEPFLMSVCRLPRILRSPQLLDIANDVHTQIGERFLRRNNTKISGVFDLCRFVFLFLSTAHYVGSLYYLLGRLQLELGIAEVSWISVDVVLVQSPKSPAIHYMRSLYWCLSTFTVDCFGDIVARNFLETVYSMSTCILGWIFIGQVIGRINVLMMSLDKEAKQHNMRVEDFDQYAKQRKLPTALRYRASHGLAFKSECLIPLRLVEIFRDLPKPLRVQLFDEMYGPLLTPLPEFKGLAKAQIEAMASVLYMEIYMPGDVIYECGRVGITLFLMKQGCAEVFSPRANVVFAAIESGMLFGECAFFIPGAKRLASTRAVRSCQVLQLDRRQWNRLWPPSLRQEIESKILEVVAPTYRDNARAYLNITKSFFIKNENAKPPRSYSQRKRSSLRKPPSPHRNTFRSNQPVAPPVAAITPRLSFSEMFFGAMSGSQTTATTSDPMNGPAASPMDSSINALTLEGSSKLRSQGSSKTLSGSFKRRNSMASAQPPANMRRQSSLNTAIDEASSVGVAVPTAADARPVTASTVERPRRKSSLTAFAEAIGLRDQNRVRPSTTIGATKTPVLESLPSDRQLLGRPSRRKSALPKLSPMAEFTWRRHEKRLAGIRMFNVGFARVEDDLKDLELPSAKRRRRASVAALPSAVEKLDSHRERLQNSTAPRRYSLSGADRDLHSELLGFDAFESEVISRSTLDKSSARRHSGVMDYNNIDDDEDDEDDRLASSRAPSSLDASGSFTMTAFVKEITRSARPNSRPSVRRRSRRVSAKVAPTIAANRVPHEIWVPQARGPDMFREGSRFRQTWDTIMLVVTLYYALVVPFRACFLHDHMDDPRFYSFVVATFVFEYVAVDLTCLLDFVLRRHHFEFIQDGERVSDRNRIAEHYWEDGTYVADLISLLPFELVAIGAMYALPTDSQFFSAGFFTPDGSLPVWRALAFARANRTLRAVFHLHPLSDRLQRFLLYELKVAWLRPSVAYFVRLALDFALGTHWIACLFFGASYLLHSESLPSWLTTPGMLVFDGSCTTLKDVSEVPVRTKYLRSFHFSIGAVTTVCYGDILPMNALETAATIVIIMLSVGLFSMLSGGFFKYFEMEFGKQADYEEKVRQVGHLMVFHQFPARMWKQMQVFFALSWQESRGMHEEEMLRGLTVSMRHEIAAHVHANLLKHVKLLSTCETQFAHALLAVLQHELYVRNDVILQRGDRGRSMYIIESGLVSIRRPESKQQRLSTSKNLALQKPKDGHHNEQATDLHDKDKERPGGNTASARLRSSKILIRDVKAAAVAALADSQPSTAPEKVVAMPTETDLPPFTHSVKLKVAPKPAMDETPAPTATVRAATTATARGGSFNSSSLRGPAVADVKFVKGPFDYFGERSLLFGTPRMATCVALCACSVYVLTLDKYEALLHEFPQYRRRNIQQWVLDSVSPVSPKPTVSRTSSRR